MSTDPLAQTLYLDEHPEGVCVTLHVPPNGAARDTGVLLCPPFGWDEVCSYRSRRNWAQELAKAGYPTLRITLPSAGDSGGMPRNGERVDAWTSAIATAARWLPTAVGVRRVAAIGIGLGGILAFRAAASGAPIEDLVLWATPGRGRALVRELRVFSKLEQSQFFRRDEEPPPPLPEGDLVAGGFLMTAETIAELEKIDLSKLSLPAAAWRRAMLLERDGIAVDQRLKQQLESLGVNVTVSPGRGFSAMMAQPQQSRTPVAVIARVTSWLEEGSEPAPGVNYNSAAPPVGSRPSAQLGTQGIGQFSERAITFPQSFGSLSGVLTEPVSRGEHGLCAVLLNAGAIRRIGPSRMWVEAARRWATFGVRTLRLDVEGIGDADGDATSYSNDAGLYVPQLTAQVLAAVDSLFEQGIGERFVLGGLCSGAYWAFHAALENPHVVAALMVNPRSLIWDPQVGPARDLRRAVLRPSEWHKLRTTSPERFKAVARWSLATPKRAGAATVARVTRRPPPEDELGQAFDRLLASGKRGLLAFSGEEPLHREMTRSGHIGRLDRWPNITLEFLPGRDHTLRPGFAQQRTHEALDRALRRELELSSARPPAPASPLPGSTAPRR